MGWIEYWDDKPTIYVNQRHRDAHYRSIAGGLVSHLGDGSPVVLDYGCGEALGAPAVARHCGHLYLCDAAPSVRSELQKRVAGLPNVTVVAPDDLAALPAGSVDLVVANSVVQYLTADLFQRCLDEWLRLLPPGGRILLADIIPRAHGPLADASALLAFARQNGFLIAATTGLVRTFFSSYRQLRAALGLQHFDEPELIALLAGKGLAARRIRPNLGHNQARMAFVATPVDGDRP